MDLYRSIDAHSKTGARRDSIRKTFDFDRNLRVGLVQLPVEWYQP